MHHRSVLLLASGTVISEIIFSSKFVADALQLHGPNPDYLRLSSGSSGSFEDLSQSSTTRSAASTNSSPSSTRSESFASSTSSTSSVRSARPTGSVSSQGFKRLIRPRKFIDPNFLVMPKTGPEEFTLYCATWNLGGIGTPPEDELAQFLLPGDEGIEMSDFYICAFQELVELNVQNMLGDPNLAKRSTRADIDSQIITFLTKSAVARAAGKGHKTHDKYVKLDSVSTVGLHVSIFAKQELSTTVVDWVRRDRYKAGMGGITGNKGAVALHIGLRCGKQLLEGVIVNVHLESGRENAEARNQQIHELSRFLFSGQQSDDRTLARAATKFKGMLSAWWAGTGMGHQRSSTPSVSSLGSHHLPDTSTHSLPFRRTSLDGGSSIPLSNRDTPSNSRLSRLSISSSSPRASISSPRDSRSAPQIGTTVLEMVDFCLIMGDFNCHLEGGLTPEQIIKAVASDCSLDLLHIGDPFTIGSIARPFHSFFEAPITFPPTYKQKPRSSAYNFSRCPAWCDRILMRGPHLSIAEYGRRECTASDHRPVIARLLLTCHDVARDLRGGRSPRPSEARPVESLTLSSRTDPISAASSHNANAQVNPIFPQVSCPDIEVCAVDAHGNIANREHIDPRSSGSSGKPRDSTDRTSTDNDHSSRAGKSGYPQSLTTPQVKEGSNSDKDSSVVSQASSGKPVSSDGSGSNKRSKVRAVADTVADVGSGAKKTVHGVGSGAKGAVHGASGAVHSVPGQMHATAHDLHKGLADTFHDMGCKIATGAEKVTQPVKKGAKKVVQPIRTMKERANDQSRANSKSEVGSLRSRSRSRSGSPEPLGGQWPEAKQAPPQK